jgi:predicted nucleotidyltransferase component of viral defense system
MAEQFLTLGHKYRAEILEIAKLKTGRPAHLLEKDIWVVWALSVLFESPLGNDLTFKGGTSLCQILALTTDKIDEKIIL